MQNRTQALIISFLMMLPLSGLVAQFKLERQQLYSSHWMTKEKLWQKNAFAQQDSNLTLIGLWPWGPCISVVAKDHYAFIGNGGLFQVFDISTPAEPQIIGELFFGGLLVYDLALSGNYAFIADGDMKVVDVSQPTNPTLAATLTVPSDFAHRIIVAGNHAYVGTFSGQLIIVDIAIPASPAVKSNIPLDDEFVVLMAIYGQYLYIKTESPIEPVYIFDVSDPTNPIRVGFLNVRTSAFATTGDHFYLCKEDSTFQIWDLTTPATPKPLSLVKTPFAGQAVAISDNFAYVIAGSILVAIIDISNPSQPFLRGSVTGWPRTTPTSLSVVSNLVIAKTSIGFWIFDVIDPDQPLALKHFATGDAALKIKLKENTAYLGCLKAGVFIVDISDSKNLKFLGNVSVGGWVDDIDVVDTLAYLSGNPSEGPMLPQLSIVSVAQSDRPQLISQVPVIPEPLPTFGGLATTAVATSKDYALVTHNWGLSIIDVSDKHNPRQIQWIQTPSVPVDIAISGHLACLANFERGLRIFDISDPKYPQEKDVLTGFAVGVATRNDTAFVATGEGLAIIKILSSGSVLKLGEVVTPGSRTTVDIALKEKSAYMAYNEDLVIVDISNPSLPVVADHTITPAFANGVAAKSSDVFVAGGPWALQIYRNNLITHVNDNQMEPLPFSPQLYPSYPNPFNGLTIIEYEIPKAGFVELKVFNVHGEEITGLVNDWQNAGRHRLLFEAKNLPSGVYFYRLRFNHNWQATHKMLILK